MAATQKRAAVWRPVFLEALASSGNVTTAAEAAGVDRSAVYKSRDRSPAFAQQWDDALAIATDLLEAEARRRAEAGVSKPVFYKGKEVGQVREYSDVLMIFLLKAHAPQKFREQRYWPQDDSGKVEELQAEVFRLNSKLVMYEGRDDAET